MQSKTIRAELAFITFDVGGFQALLGKTTEAAMIFICRLIKKIDKFSVSHEVGTYVGLNKHYKHICTCRDPEFYKSSGFIKDSACERLHVLLENMIDRSISGNTGQITSGTMIRRFQDCFKGYCY